MADTKFGTFDELVEAAEEDVRPIMLRLRRIVLDLDADAVEVVRLGDRAATYGVGPKKMSEGYVYILPHTKWVNLGFYRGVDLPDPKGVLEGTGAKMRHVKIRTLEDADRRELETLVKAAKKERATALGR